MYRKNWCYLEVLKEVCTKQQKNIDKSHKMNGIFIDNEREVNIFNAVRGSILGVEEENKLRLS